MLHLDEASHQHLSVHAEREVLHVVLSVRIHDLVGLAAAGLQVPEEAAEQQSAHTRCLNFVAEACLATSPTLGVN